MNSFNLVPAEYKQQRIIWSDLKTTGVLSGFILLAVAGLYLTINYSILDYKARLEEIAESRKQIESTRAEMHSIEESKQKLESRYTLMKGLKGNISAQGLFAAIDSSLSNDIEFEALSFNRAGEPVESEKAAVKSSYFIVIPESDGILKTRYDALRIDANMNIRGRAKTHSAMATFMTKLAQQKQIDRVELLRSGGKPKGIEEWISFELFIVINNERGYPS